MHGGRGVTPRLGWKDAVILALAAFACVLVVLTALALSGW